MSFIVWSSIFVPLPIIILTLGSQFFLEGSITWQTLIEYPNYKGWISILFQSFITTLLGYGIWTMLITKYGLSNIAPYSLLVPISGLFFGWFIYSEKLMTNEIFGSIFVIIGLILLSIKIKTIK